MMLSSHDIHLDTILYQLGREIEETKLYQSGREIVKRLKERMELLRKEMQATRRLMKKSE